MDLIEDFVRSTSNMASPEQFRRWCAVSMVSTALTRRVWTCIEDARSSPGPFSKAAGAQAGKLFS